MLAARAFAMLPELPMFYHQTSAKKSANVFGDPQAVQKREEIRWHLHCIPINVMEGQLCSPLFCS
jgi:hypothetical protein